MFCANCGAQVSDGAPFCAQCGAGTAPVPGLKRGPGGPGLVVMIALGFLAGGFIGFLLRPSVFLLGQLPFEMVITRGSALAGIDQLLVPAAQQSFNVMLLGAIIGSATGFALSRFRVQGRS
jgi:hypothetical protein